jgi:transposase
MPRIKVLLLQPVEQKALQHGFEKSPSPAFRRRCQIILLKSQGYTSSHVAQIAGTCEMSVNNWVHRYETQGLKGLETKPGRGRKAILQESDLESVKEAVANHRQRLSVAHAELEQTLDKSFCPMTLRRFVKKTVASINDCESVPAASRSRKFTSSKSKP